MDLAVKKGHEGKVYRSKQKEMISNAFCYYNKTMNASAAGKETRKALGCSEKIVYSLPTQQGALISPPKKKPKSGYQKNTRTHCFFLSNIPSTLTSVNMDNHIPNSKRTTLYNPLLDISMVFKQPGKKYYEWA
ncbi:hypothetical protein Trydic_g18294 [Trypoxylus dichotomus]